MGLINGFKRGVGEVADFYRRTGSELLENGLTGARKQMSKSWSGGIEVAGKKFISHPKMSKTGKAMTAFAGYQGYRKVRDPGHNVPLVPFL